MTTINYKTRTQLIEDLKQCEADLAHCRERISLLNNQLLHTANLFERQRAWCRALLGWYEAARAHFKLDVVPDDLSSRLDVDINDHLGVQITKPIQ